MKLYAAKIDPISSEIIKSLISAEDLEVSDISESELDVAAVLKEYVRLDQELTERAKDILEIRGLSYSALGRTKRTLAEQKNFGLGEEGMTWICNQLLETFMQSSHVEEVYADDATLRKKIKNVLKRYMGADEELDHEVRDRIKNIQEGTQTWDVEYQRVMNELKRKRGLGE